MLFSLHNSIAYGFGLHDNCYQSILSSFFLNNYIASEFLDKLLQSIL